MMQIKKANTYPHLSLTEEQVAYISNTEKIECALLEDSCLGFHAVINEEIVGFALFRAFKPQQFFLWDFLIDIRYQGQGYGKLFLRLLIQHLKDNYSATVITTTYVFGNEIAKKLYESFGFLQTDIAHTETVHEINMRLTI